MSIVKYATYLIRVWPLEHAGGPEPRRGDRWAIYSTVSDNRGTRNGLQASPPE
jgi:hypothetical protein